MSEIPALQKLGNALVPLPTAAIDGGYQLNVSGTVNIIGGGSGGTSMTDDNPFTPGSTSITPMGGYFGPRQVGSGHAAAPALSNSAIMLVDVRAGGAGGGVANLTVRGSANSDLHVGYASGANFNNDGGAYMPVLGSVNVGNSLTVTGSVNITGSLNPVGVFGSLSVVGSVNAVLGTLPLPIVGSIFTTPIATQTVWYGGGFADTGNSAVRVNVVAGGAGGGLAQLQVVGTDNSTFRNVGFPSGGSPSVNAVPVNIVAGGAAGGGFASVAVYGSPANPVYVVGSVNVVNTVTVTGTVNTAGGGGFATAAVYGSPAFPVYAVGSVNVVNTITVTGTVNTVGGGGGGFATAAVYGSPAFPVYAIGTVHMDATVTVNMATTLDQVNDAITVYQGAAASLNVTATLSGVSKTDPRGNLVGTQWPISHTGSGYLALAVASANPSVRVKIHAINVTADNSAVVSFQSPSGTFLTGSMRIPGAAGFNIGVPMPSALWIGAANATFYMQAIGSQNIGGWISGWVE